MAKMQGFWVGNKIKKRLTILGGVDLMVAICYLRGLRRVRESHEETQEWIKKKIGEPASIKFWVGLI